MKGKAALITGSSRGIGRAIALELASRGVNIAVNYSSSEQQADELVGMLRAKRVKAQSVKADISVVSEIGYLFDKVINWFGGIDILVNNAGIMLNKPIEQVDENEFDRVFDINIKGLFFCCQQAAEKMNRGGRIINIGTSVTRVMLPGYATYAASKGAVEQLTKVLAKELGVKGITVNTVSPGPTNTELFRQGKTAAQIEALAEMSAFSRIAEPEDIARSVTMLCSDATGWISGQNIFVNGAFVAG